MISRIKKFLWLQGGGRWPGGRYDPRSGDPILQSTWDSPGGQALHQLNRHLVCRLYIRRALGQADPVSGNLVKLIIIMLVTQRGENCVKHVNIRHQQLLYILMWSHSDERRRQKWIRKAWVGGWKKKLMQNLIVVEVEVENWGWQYEIFKYVKNFIWHNPPQPHPRLLGDLWN